MPERKKILALPGSLRAESSSNVVLNIIAGLTPANIDFEIFDQIGTLPHFNDPKEVPEIIIQFRKRIKEASGVLICTPEYAFGVPGSLKNALDWTVGSGDFVDKPVALVTASSQGEKGHAAMLNILTAISAKVPPGAELLLSFIRAKLAGGELKDKADLAKVKALFTAFINSFS